METETYQEILRTVKRTLGIDLTHYKDQQMRRRLDTYLLRSGIPSWADYLTRLKVDRTEQGRFRDFLTINVSSFFRDPDRWQGLQDGILPRLLQEALGRRLNGEIRLWSAGCSMGAEPYTLAILLAEMARGRHAYILATDLDRGVLAKARAGGPFKAEEVQAFNNAQKISYFNPGAPPYFIRPFLTQRVTFREHNLLSDPFERDFDLIVCRNVMIYFNPDAKNLLFREFHQALRPGGVLFLGGAEIIPFPHQLGFRSCGPSFYERV
ncbi:MAG: protein-glutamate O-methyltransferase CheR [Anaerolineales bacterium]|nr:protein-glutamate O-methyltransferase CheR [Anaerolineales bacterium]